MTRAERRIVLDQSMKQLVADPKFAAYMEILKEGREAVILDLCSDGVASNDRKTLAAIGELRTYQHQLDAYTQIKENLAGEDVK